MTGNTDAIDISFGKVVVSLMIIGLAAAAAGAGTMALFSDTEQSTDNTMQAGSLDLTIDGDNDATTNFQVEDAAPGDSGHSHVNLSNEGSIDGTLDVNISEAVNEENGMNEPEEAVDDSEDEGELGDHAEVEIFIDADEDGEFNESNGDVMVANGTINEVADEDYDIDAPLAAGEESDLHIDWSVPSEAGNEIQSDGVSFDVTVELTQTESE